MSSSPALLHEAENFTLFIKNSISFPRFKVNRCVGNSARSSGGCPRLPQLLSAVSVSLHSCWHGRNQRGIVEPMRGPQAFGSSGHPPGWHTAAVNTFHLDRRNLVEEVNAAYMKTCLYHKTLHPLCPVFQLGYVVQESGQNFSTLAEKGGVVGITIDWHCDFDWHVRHCKPIYEFHGLYEEKNLSPGFNFRFARHFVENGTNHRHLFKVFGIRFDILVDGKAGKFDIIPTMTTIGSGIGIFGVATVLCDLLLLHILPKRRYYKQKKFKYAEDMQPAEVRELPGPALRDSGTGVCVEGGGQLLPQHRLVSPNLAPHTQGEHDPAATSSTLGLQENMRVS
ncbi:P2X purinoceptor 1 [Saguinus oedipus]|uniref:P2X purinoceptor 1 n=1 Tax=Saguinus oedipus TaxID=9490 RepID=A0ABQ9VQW7_SAGOE|nr:P2X purinoceptor 1 [Saguinus oedipus]